MLKLQRVLLGAALLLAFTELVIADKKDSHTVTVRLVVANKLEINGENLILTINNESGEAEPELARREATSNLNWKTDKAPKKITVEPRGVGSGLAISVLARGVSRDHSEELTLDTEATDLITGTSMSIGNCYVSYHTNDDTSDNINRTVYYTLTDM